MLRLVLLLVLPVAAALPGFVRAAEDACPPGDGTRQVQSSGEAIVGHPMPGFAGWTLRDGPWSWARPRDDRPGQVQVVTFFATWCEPCVRSVAAFRSLRQAPGGRDVVVIYVALGQEAEEVAPFVEAHGLEGIVLLDPFRKVGRRLGVEQSIPRTFVVDPRGAVRAIFVSEGKGFARCLKATVEAARTASPVARLEARPEAAP